MEKITCICVMRELMMALSDFENKLMEAHGVSLNEAMVLCALGGECVTASVIAERTGLRPSHTSKVIGALEERGYLMRELGKQDKRQMYLSLTEAGKECLGRIKAYEFEVPELLKPVFEGYQKN
ncbi:MAG: winged helix DNA-binding protein [Bacteroidaceae bacterium]|nr:winged helix DNA-binding protein [Bacteroidaceae bacterium]